ncbi:SHOCT domain-containing protein [Kitasatospora sp. McL0602]|uniref:SHOCT domain-containing protein n=1 Tax=Kitasatospora sp. McL0602 TaxID=3439530 RepID=UPI003F8AEB87
MRHYPHFEHHVGWGWVFPGILMLLLFLVLVAVLVALWRTWSHRTTPTAAAWHGPGHPAPPPPPSPEQVLADRLARGEIDVDDYHQRLAALRAGPPPGAQPPQTGPQP